MTDKLKLLPREATREMLEAMDECSMEGYDERLYAGYAGSVYMAAWDAFYGQHCYCGDITSLGVIHRDDGPCHYPDHKESKPEQDKERCVGCEACIDTACGRDECPKGWPKAAQPELCKYGQEPKSCTSSPMDCQCAIDATLAQPEQPDLDAICQDLQEKTYNQAMRIAELEAQLAQTEQEPFGYFKPEPFGWTDCAETDEGAIALYDRPHRKE